MSYIVMFFAIVVIIIFFIWQGKVIFKYLKCDVLKIDTLQKVIIVNNQTILFDEIQSIDVEMTDEPNVAERYFTRYAHFHTMYKIIFKMKNSEVKEFVVNSTALLYKYLDKMKPYIQVDVDVEEFKPKFVDGPTIFGLSLVIIYLLFKFFKG